MIGVERVDEMVRFGVRDTGDGIVPEKLDAIFERFRQLDSHDRRGVGLGLYIAKSIVQGGYGGTIWAQSEPGKGSALFFTIPIPPSSDAPV